MMALQRLAWQFLVYGLYSAHILYALGQLNCNDLWYITGAMDGGGGLGGITLP